MNKPKFNVKSIIVLTAICLIVAALLAVTNHFTSPVVEKTRQQKIVDSLKEVLPDMTNPPEPAPSPAITVGHIIDPDSEVRGVWIASVWNLDYPSRADLSAAQLEAEADAILNDCTENEVFGDRDADFRHWDKYCLAAMTKHYDELAAASAPASGKS